MLQKITNFLAMKQISTDKQKSGVAPEFTGSLGRTNYNKYNNPSQTKVLETANEELESTVTNSKLWIGVD